MRLCRRRFLQLTASVAALPLPRVALAEAYPTRPVRWIVPYAAGPSDVLARLMGRWLSDRLGQQIVIENRPGGGTNIATEAVVRAPADGYTLLLSTSSAVVAAPHAFPNMPVNTLRDLTPISMAMRPKTSPTERPELPTAAAMPAKSRWPVKP